MASTNKTTNYELSQFVGSDIPAWLSDYNGDMSKIDAGIHAAKVQADGAANGVSALQTVVSGKQNTLTFDAAPLADSANPVTSGGIYNALQNVSVQTDAVPTEGSTKAVQSGGVWSAIHEITFYGAGTSVYGAGKAIQFNNFILATIKAATSVAKNTLVQVSGTPVYARTLAFHFAGNPLNLPVYAENSAEWYTNSQNCRSTIKLFNGNNCIGDLMLTLRYDGTNTYIVESVLGDVYAETWTSATFTANALTFFA